MTFVSYRPRFFFLFLCLFFCLKTFPLVLAATSKQKKLSRWRKSFTYGKKPKNQLLNFLSEQKIIIIINRKTSETKEDFHRFFFLLQRKKKRENTRVMHNTCPVGWCVSLLYGLSSAYSRYHGKHEEIRKQPLKQFTAELVLPSFTCVPTHVVTNKDDDEGEPTNSLGKKKQRKINKEPTLLFDLSLMSLVRKVAGAKEMCQITTNGLSQIDNNK